MTVTVPSELPAALDELILEIERQSDIRVQQRLLTKTIPHLTTTETEQLVERLVELVVALQLADSQRALSFAQLIEHVAQLTGSPIHEATGLRAHAQVLLISRGEYESALRLYDGALAIYREQDDELGTALVQITRIWALASTGQYEAAFSAGAEAAKVLAANARWLALANLQNNLAAIYNRVNEYENALEMIGLSSAAYRREGPASQPFLASNELTRGFILFNLGRLDDAVTAYGSAIELAEATGQNQVVAQAQSNLGQVQFSRGNYNEALQLFDRAARTFSANDLTHDALLTDLAATDCLVELRQFVPVLEKCHRLEQQLAQAGLHLESAQAIYNAGLAYVGLLRYQAAQQAFDKARAAFHDEGNAFWVAVTRLRTANVLALQGHYAASLEVAIECADLFSQLGAAIESAQAQLMAAQAALAMDDKNLAEQFVAIAMRFAEAQDIPQLTYQGHRLRGELRRMAGQNLEAIAHYEQAIQQIERLQARLMLEYRADFLVDKEQVYGQIVRLYVEQGHYVNGLAYAERAKSRALHDMLAYRIDVRVPALSNDDLSTVAELNNLRQRRNRLAVSRAARPGQMETATSDIFQETQQDIAQLEQAITERWHTLLVRNADYARDADFWPDGTDFFAQEQLRIREAIPQGALLLEYFIIEDELWVFLVTNSEVRVRQLPVSIQVIQQWLQRLGLNLRAVPGSAEQHLDRLTANVTGTLEQLSKLLLLPIAGELADFSRLIIVPHGALHYLPFHALRLDGRYLLETHEISYLPGARFLRFCQEPVSPANELLAVGHSYQGNLPYAVREAQVVSDLWQGETLMESAATVERTMEAMSHYRLIHLATHGDFRPDNPLFSGLALADGWLTTLDIFGLRLQASLVTLSACQTGLSVVSGGDELLGLMRAFLAAGAASLTLSMWPVEDQSTAQLMTTFYARLAAGDSKSQALRRAQLGLLHEVGGHYAHPYYWAPFFLVGHAGPIQAPDQNHSIANSE